MPDQLTDRARKAAEEILRALCEDPTPSHAPTDERIAAIFERHMREDDSGIGIVAREREEQIKKHGFDILHDDQWENNELVMAAIYYALPEKTVVREEHMTADIEPEAFFAQTGWDWYSWANRESKGRIECLAIAGALIAAEIDRLNRRQETALCPKK